ncbi:FAD-binding and (Fe-S)-binding domain-containing protein [Fodinibius sediminis]|uniref:FAD/FMN-containing dehydrogenase n=1 Tax=Fodinibius sediminis TaxID=1214077 RepID=A0A521AL12_9BACT|nr:FAD-binding and (Fe-S)-binding domain-containing protein [Fodinibius sediminis]SMO35509.1 FAD/FMN-containing dehydrogenase [Fodinibius sediminis]
MISTAPKLFTDEQTRRLYATDASSYEELPEAVAFPKTTAEIVGLVAYAREQDCPLTARGAGTSLAGQTTGGGIIMDIGRNMNQIMDIDPQGQTARVRPGVIRDTLNRQAAQYNLLFGPDTATTNRCMIGGMIGNNSCGLFSIKHRTTREHVLEIEAVLSDGSKAVFKPLTPTELTAKMELDTLEGKIYREMTTLLENHREQILENYPHPQIIRRNTGYALDRLCEMQPFTDDGRPFNMAELLCGSEGTLAITTSAKLNLVPQDPEKVVLVPHFSSIRAAMEATVEAVKMDPAAVELVDDIILNATKGNIEQQKNRFFLDGDPKGILIIQFDGDNRSRLKTKAEELARRLQDLKLSASTPIITDPDKIDRVWHLRKAGLGLLMGLGAKGRTPTFCEDTAVRVVDLPNYVDDFQKILDRHNSNCVFYAHASVGELHLRPVINLKKEQEIEKMKTMAGEIADLVRHYRGSLSGEHGDGRTRAPYIEKVLGPEMMPLLKQVKHIWDPQGLFNPGKIVNPKPMEQDLRYSPSYRPPSVNTQFKWRKEESFSDAVELCNGAGVCRKLADSGGTMCPSYMATQNEKDSTRGRANLFRQLFSGRQQEAFQSGELRDALDLCLSCKACKSECPANVDMARMKAEFMHGWHQANGISLGERFFAQAANLYPLAGQMPRFSNWMMRQPAVKELLYQLLGIDKRRRLPEFAREPFDQWLKERKEASPSPASTDKPGVVLLVDIFTNYHEPDIAKAALHFLEATGHQVIVPAFHELGRPQLSKGMVSHAKEVLDEHLPLLSAYADRGLPIVGIEPSEILTLRDEYLDLCDDNQLKSVQKIAKQSFTFEEFAQKVLAASNAVPSPDTRRKVYIHGHCHAKALIGNEATHEALRLAGYDPEILETGCCGMAGSFGYEERHYDVSMDIGELTLFPALRPLPDDALICVPGFSCRHQIEDGVHRQAVHPAQLLAASIQ